MTERTVATSFDVLKSKRRTIRAAVTRDITDTTARFADVTSDNSVDAETQVRKLTRHQTTLSALNQQILDAGQFADADLPAELERQQEYSDRLGDAIDRLEVLLRRVQRTAESATHGQNQPGGQKLKVKTPKLTLTTFEGDPLRWEEFWDDFTCSVDSRTDLTTIDKFKLLKQSLRSEALSVADGYFLTQNNYQEVKDALRERFGDPQIFAHFEALLELKPASHEVEQLIRIRDKCEAHIRSLTALGLSEDNYGMVFAPIILSKLPRFVKMEMHRKNGSVRWTLPNLRKHLKVEIEVRTKSDRAFSGATSDASSSLNRPKVVKVGGKLHGTGSALFSQAGSKGRGKLSARSKPNKARSCPSCQGDYRPWDCTKFATAEDRMKQVKGRCYGCLSDRHMKSACPSSKKCYYCDKSGHHSSLCFTQFGKPSNGDSRFSTPSKKFESKTPQANENDSDSSNLVQHLNPNAQEFLPNDDPHQLQLLQSSRLGPNPSGMAVLESALVPIQGSRGTLTARVVFDNGSTLSFVRTGFAKKIGAKVIGQRRTMLGRFGQGSRDEQMHAVVQLRFQLQDGSQSVLAFRQVENISSPLKLAPVPLETLGPMFSPDEFAGLVDQPENVEIDILIGLDYYYDIVGPEIWRAPSGVVIKQTAVGKVLTGFVREQPEQKTGDQQLLIMAGPDRSKEMFDLERFWRLEDAGLIDKTGRSDDQIAVDLFNNSIRFSEGRYEVKWPFKENPPNLPLNYDVALRRLSSVHRKLIQTPGLLSTYDEILRDQLSKGVIEQAPESPQGPLHYLPHHAVVIPKRETTKVRLVFDASSKPNSQYHSLNESMYRGPVFLNDLCGLLLRFRTPTYAVTSDVEKAFLQISLHKEHRDCTRFLWLRDVSKAPTPGNLVVYRYTRVLFGATASPFLLAATIIHHMKQANTPISDSITESTYMDNIITGFSHSAGLHTYFEEAKLLFSEMSMNLHQWYSNDQRFLEAIPPEEKGTRKTPSVLGLKWDIAKDSLSCSVGTMTTTGPTKRKVLQGIATVYDPCGWFSAVTIAGKILMQSLWKAKMDWDEKLSLEFAKSWDAVSSSLLALPQYSIPRQYSVHGSNKCDACFQLHVFCDASAKAYAACVYLRVESGGQISCDLLFAKSRVAPVKTQTIPKLELLAAHLGTRVLQFVEQHLKLPINSKVLWSDSLCVLCWIDSDKVSTVFVQNRVREIRAVSNLELRFVPSEYNPADLGSRGTSAAFLASSSLWWHGPNWLKGSASTWPERPLGRPVVPEKEKAGVQLLTLADQVHSEEVFEVERFSTLQKLLRVTAYVNRACLRFKGEGIQASQLTAGEMADSLHFWEKRVQGQHFSPILTNSKDVIWKPLARQLGLFVDKDKLIRCRGRFQFIETLSEKAKFPLLLPRCSAFTKLVIIDCHLRVLHFGVKHTLAKLRERYWVCRGRSVVKSILIRCQVCRIHSGGPFKVPDPAPLPSYRAAVKRPFESIGLDYLGPLFVADSSQRSKVWIVLFTCAVTRAIHLEMVHSLSAADFLMSFRRFAAMYGTPQVMVSDNARQFKAADQLLKNEFKRLSEDESVTTYLAGSGIDWKYIVEKAPWMGGFYERLVATVKEALKKTLGRWTIKSVELQTICYEVAFVVNSRPLIYAEDDPSSHVLTPLDLMFRSNNCFADGSGEEVVNENLTRADELLMHWKAGQNLLRQFWDDWKNHYLVSLRESSRLPHQRGTSEIPVREGAVVLIKDNLPRGQWKVGKIKKLRKSHDHQVRAAEIRMPSGTTLVRPLKLLYPIEASIDSQSSQTATVAAAANQAATQTPASAIPGRPQRNAARIARNLTKQTLAGL